MTPETPITEVPVAAPPPGPGWNIFDVIFVVLFGIASFVFATSVTLALIHFIPSLKYLDPSELVTNPMLAVPVQAAAYLLAFTFTRMFITLRARQDFWVAVKWNFPRTKEAFTFAFAGVVLALASQMVSHFLPVPKSLPIDRYFTQSSYAYLMLAFGILVAPIIEELLFRGLIFPVAERSMGLVAGAIITSLFFALLHQGQLAHAWAPLLLLFAVGMVLTLVRALANSLAASWIVHLAYNATLFGLLLYATGGFTHMERLK